jgi:hypothetical protein
MRDYKYIDLQTVIFFPDTDGRLCPCPECAPCGHFSGTQKYVLDVRTTEHARA